MKISRYSENVAVVLRTKTIMDRRTKKPKTISVPTDTICSDRVTVNKWITDKTKELTENQ